MTQIQQDYIDWYEAEKKKGLKEVRFSLACMFDDSLPKPELDDVLAELLAADKAIADGRYTPIPDNL